MSFTSSTKPTPARQVKVGAACVCRTERRASGRQEAERQAAEYANTCAGNASNDEDETAKTAKKEKEVVENEETAKKEVKTAKKDEEAANISESAGINDEQRHAKIETKDAEAPCMMGAIGDRFEIKTEKFTVNEGESVELKLPGRPTYLLK